LFWLLPQFLLLPLALLDRATNAIQHGVARCSAVAIELTGRKRMLYRDAEWRAFFPAPYLTDAASRPTYKEENE